MAHLHFRVTPYKAGGQAAVARVAYITRQPVHPLTRAEQQLRYLGIAEGAQQREDCLFTQSHNLPAFANGNAHVFFAAAEAHEGSGKPMNEKYIRVAFCEWKITLPHELTHGQNLDLAKEILDATFGTVHPYVYAIHVPKAVDGTEQIHMHVLWSARTLDGVERTPEQFFRRPDGGGARKSRRLTHMGAVREERPLLCDLTNLALERYGHAARVDPRSLADRGIDRPPEPKLHPSDSAMLKRYGKTTEAMQHVLDCRVARQPHAAAEQAQAAAAWEARKVKLGLTRDTPHAEALVLVQAARTRASAPRPRKVPRPREVSPARALLQRPAVPHRQPAPQTPVQSLSQMVATLAARMKQRETLGHGGGIRVKLHDDAERAKERGMSW